MMGIAGFAAVLALAAAAAGAEWLQSIPPSRSIVFKAASGTTALGVHKVSFEVDGDAVTAKTEIDLGAKVLFIPVFKYQHRSTERWRAGQLLSIASTTDDDGEKSVLDGRTDGAQFRIQATGFAGVVPGPIAPTSYWNYENLRKSRWFSTQSGKVVTVSVAAKGVETIPIRGVPSPARRYEVTGDFAITLWYDAQNRWVKSRFTVNDSEIVYTLQ
jgi:hypothetical protein